MDTSPVSPQDVRAAAEVHAELGPEYQDAVVAAFVDKVEREVDARVRARLAAMYRPEIEPLRRATLLKGIAIGAGAGALVAFATAGITSSHAAPAGPPPIFKHGPAPAWELPAKLHIPRPAKP